MWILVIITILLTIYYYFYNKEPSICNLVENFTSLYKCPKYALGNMYKKVLDKCKIKRINDKDKCDIYMPCGYTNVENELKQLKLYKKSHKIYGISGCDNIVSKNGLWFLLETKYGRQRASTLMPETYLYSDPKSMKLFMRNFDPQSIYLMKKNIQRKEGISLSSDINKILSNRNTAFRVIQRYVPDLFLIKKRKVNLRIYLLVVCQNTNVKCYIHRLGKCIYTNKDFDDKIDNNNKYDHEVHLTSLNLSKDVYDNRPETLFELRKYLGNTRYNTLMEKMYENLTIVLKAVKYKLCKLAKISNNLTFQLFGLDYIFNNNMVPYLLEMNKGPDMSNKSPKDSITKQTVLHDVFKTTRIVSDEDKPSGFIQLNC